MDRCINERWMNELRVNNEGMDKWMRVKLQGAAHCYRNLVRTLTCTNTVQLNNKSRYSNYSVGSFTHYSSSTVVLIIIGILVN